MKDLKQIIIEKLVINKNTKVKNSVSNEDEFYDKYSEYVDKPIIDEYGYIRYKIINKEFKEKSDKIKSNENLGDSDKYLKENINDIINQSKLSNPKIKYDYFDGSYAYVFSIYNDNDMVLSVSISFGYTDKIPRLTIKPSLHNKYTETHKKELISLGILILDAICEEYTQ